MMGTPAAPAALFSRLLWVSAAIWLCATFVAERVLEFHDGLPRTALIVGLFSAVAGAANFGARRLSRSPVRYLAWLVWAGIAARHLQRSALRHEYTASAPLSRVGPRESLWHPITTTDVVLRYYAVSSDRLAAPRLRLVLLTDLHFTPALPRAYYERVFDLVAAQGADLILLAGDYVSKPANVALLASLFDRHWPARFGAFGVLGNHDHWTDAALVRKTLGSRGVQLVGGRCEHLPAELGRVAICGSEAPWGPELSAALDRSELNLVLSHTPDNVYRLAEQGASLVLSGHTHGGQLRVPGLGAIVVPSRFGALFDQGHFRVAGSELIVSAGVGADEPPLRIYCPPEIAIVDLTRR